MGDGYSADPQRLLAYASTLSGYAASVGQAADAAGEVISDNAVHVQVGKLSGNLDVAFGIICQQVGVALQTVEQASEQAISQIVSMLNTLSVNVGDCARNYLDTESGVQHNFTHINSQEPARDEAQKSDGGGSGQPPSGAGRPRRQSGRDRRVRTDVEEHRQPAGPGGFGLRQLCPQWNRKLDGVGTRFVPHDGRGHIGRDHGRRDAQQRLVGAHLRPRRRGLVRTGDRRDHDRGTREDRARRRARAAVGDEMQAAGGIIEDITKTVQKVAMLLTGLVALLQTIHDVLPAARLALADIAKAAQKWVHA